MNKTLWISSIITVTIFSTNVLVRAENFKTPSGIPYSELELEIDAYARDYIGKTTAGETIINRSYGYNDIENKAEVNADKVFEWGSITKLLVWTSVMQLAEQEKLDLDEDIRTYLPDGLLTKLQYDKPITMMNLMHHDAGWEDRYIDLFYLSADQLTTLEEALLIPEPVQVNEPCRVVGYSNYGVALAGFIVEEIANRPFYTYVNENIFDVLGMEDTAIHPAQEDNEDIAEKRELIRGYFGDNEGEFSPSNKDRIYINMYPAGNAIGTAEVAAKIMAALMPKEVENTPLFRNNVTLDEMLTITDVYDNGVHRNAHGFWASQYAVEMLGHAGITERFSADLTFSKAENLGIIVMTNQAGEIGLFYGLSPVLFGEYPVGDDIALPDTAEVEGNYITTRSAHHGFTKLYGAFVTGKVEAVDEQTIQTLGMTFKQVASYEYISTDEMDLYLEFKMNDDE
ncbi:serine hydrolase domain-containing protein [Oceanobacillus arenosus]|uniref:serine hydrolase domain-containing protein n=1 Tax=Oceanobacillus arenosus TaxID=1229153 RepID=UPI001FEA0DC6|nr:serine hydrolase [Oceanobacillus arenosus]